MAKIELDLAGVLNYLAANPSTSLLWGADWAANMAWPAINSQRWASPTSPFATRQPCRSTTEVLSAHSKP